MQESHIKIIIQFITNRLFVLSIIFVLMFSILVVKLFQLQIIHGEEYQRNLVITTIRTLPLPANRGSIYDRFGRPLAVNHSAFTVKIDPSITVNNLNESLTNLITLLEKNGDQYVDDFPISKEEPYAFLFSSDSAEKRWKEDMGLEKDMSAANAFDELRRLFKLPVEMSNTEARKLLSFRSALYVQRYKAYNPLVLASNVSMESITVIEEQNELFQGMFVDVAPLRTYPQGENFSHILGYIRGINDEELAEYEQYGYVGSDLIGKTGIEKFAELSLNGEKGEWTIETNAVGKRIKEVDLVPSVPGHNVFLTLDASLQKKSMEILLENLKEVLLSKLNKGEITLKQLFSSMVDSNSISIEKIIGAKEGTVQNDIRKRIREDSEGFTLANEEDKERAKEKMINAIQTDVLSARQIVLCLYEQGIITCDDAYVEKIQRGMLSPFQVIREKIISGEITPQATNLDPSTGSVAVVDVNTGAVLSLVTYPTYDNNMLVNNFNYAYYKKLLDDKTTPLVNRPLSTGKAPGSTLKMATAIAGLESGVITTATKIQDKGVYTKAGEPYAKCLVYSRYGSTHGLIDVRKALEVSCNYFFYDTVYRMGSTSNGNSLEGIATLNTYLKAFGLDDYSGVEIDYFKPQMASPDTEYWSDGQTIRAAIGQSSSSYTTTNMAKYIATLANGGTRYKLHVIDKVVDCDGKEISKTEPFIEEKLDIDPRNLEAVYEGMLDVTSGSDGSLRKIFSDFPIQVAGKSGTAEEDKRRSSHTWFTGFAPYDKPQIAVVVLIPFGESSLGPASKIAKEIMSEYFKLDAQPETDTKINSLER